MYLQNITRFLEEYLDVPEWWKNKDGSIMDYLVSTCVAVLIHNKVFTKEEMKAEAVRNNNVIIAEKYFCEVCV